jgi:hypothetical protein
MGFISENCMGNMWCNDAQIGKDMWLHRKKKKINNGLFSNGEKTSQSKYKTKIRLSSESSKRTVGQDARDDGVSGGGKRTGIIRRNSKKNHVGKEKKTQV